MTRIKCCGMTRHDDVQLAARLGADAVGFVFTRRSKRFIEPEAAAVLRAALPPFVDAVALLMDDEPAWVAHVIDVVQPDLVQFHGEETDDFCKGFGRRYLKAIAMGDGEAALHKLHTYPGAAGLLLDGHGLGESGGTGRVFDWSLMPKDFPQPLILAGGLDSTNVARAIALAQPWAVDVASGIESSPGVKDAAKMEHFIAAVRRGQGT
ncbi:phosphoribosylanthranilate isomerase [Pinirhizobacter sp.]|jgi:phosphoribosylanthranilate isomerase|uniref:phosphoribosylanthranilate isomerase n=1 Tax=Pinirhizobacter sp. TaxID=2950432 RepID=UPI002F4130D0